MELLTTVRDIVSDIRDRHLAPETHIRVIIYDSKTGWEQVSSPPAITPEEQRRRLGLLPTDYEPGASQELIRLIEASHTNPYALFRDSPCSCYKAGLGNLWTYESRTAAKGENHP